MDGRMQHPPNHTNQSMWLGHYDDSSMSEKGTKGADKYFTTTQ